MNHDRVVENKLKDIYAAIGIIGLLIAIIAITVLVSALSKKHPSRSRFHYRTIPGQVFDSDTGKVYDVDTGKVVFQVKE